MTRLAAALVAFVVLFAAGRPAAHPLGPSLLELREEHDGRFEVRWKTPAKGTPGATHRPTLPGHCGAASPPRLAVEEAAVVERWTVDCGERGLAAATIEIGNIASSRADVILRIAYRDGRLFRTVLTASVPSVLVPARETKGAVVLSYLRLGVAHILQGLDHLLFVLGLVLLVRGRALFWTVTAFTLGHSVTLSAAALGFVHVPTAPVEAAIAASIVWLAVELTRHAKAPGRLRRRPWAMSAGFGLLHGFGFAGALAETGLPAGEIPLALLSFNLGIEVGQIAFVLAVLALGVSARGVLARLPDAARFVPAYAIGSLAAMWLLERVRPLLGV